MLQYAKRLQYQMRKMCTGHMRGRGAKSEICMSGVLILDELAAADAGEHGWKVRGRLFFGFARPFYCAKLPT
jgi:hypothetical protein